MARHFFNLNGRATMVAAQFPAGGIDVIDS